MTLSAGTRLGPYEIQAVIGAGGMGEVYKARDTRLDRSVAIKVLPAQVSADPERRARFEREAKTIAGLNHPHICTLYDVGESDGSTFLVMEHLTGETLAARLEKGPLPLEQALTVGSEIADALSAAHRQGVVHRDLKPGNVMLTKAGAKLLDFGLAKLKGHGEQPAAAHLATAPTQSTPLTGEGMIVGTLQYMAPEQVEGKPADARTDLWALGTILYEMLTGKRAFEGTSAASLITAIMAAEPPALTALQPLTPPGVDRLVRRCLAKDPDERWQNAHDVADELRWIREMGGPSTAAGMAAGRPRRWHIAPAVAAAGVVVGLVLGAGLMWLLRPPAAGTALAGLSLNLLPAEEVNGGSVAFLPTPGGSRTALAWTPDGQALVFAGRRGGVRQLYVRRLASAEARPLPNTERAQAPAVSPDGQWVAFWARGAIRKVPLGGGPVMDLASGIDTPPWGLVWGASGRLFFGREDGRIWAIPPDGAPAAVTKVGETEVGHTLPWPLPGEQALLYTVRRRVWSWGAEEVVAETLATGARKVLLKDAADARYLPTGHLVFLRQGVLFAVPFDAEHLEVRGTPVAVLEDVAQAIWEGGAAGDVTGAGQFAVAATGALAWVPSPVVPFPDATLVTVDRRGQVAPLAAPARGYVGPVRRSPDGRRLSVTIKSHSETGVWVYDLERGTLTPLTGAGEAAWTLWSPDGKRLVFDWLADGRPALASQPADGTAPPRVLAPHLLYPSSFAPDGQRLVAVAVRPGNLMVGHVVVVAVENGQGSVQPLIQTSHTESWPEVSPDGRWLAYGSDESGRFEVYVQPYPGPGPRTQVSVDGGESPAWHPNGRELFFLGSGGTAGKPSMMAVDFAGPGAAGGPQIGRPRSLFEFDWTALYIGCSPVRCYDVAPDGQRFYAVQMRRSPPRLPATHINLIPDWLEELKARVPIK